MHHEHWMKDTSLTFVQVPWWITYIYPLRRSHLFLSSIWRVDMIIFVVQIRKLDSREIQPHHINTRTNIELMLLTSNALDDGGSWQCLWKGASETWLNKVVWVCGIELNTREQAHVILCMSQRLGDPLCRIAEGLRWYRYIHVPLKVDRFAVYARTFSLLL